MIELILPMIMAIIIFLLFSWRLSFQVKTNLFGELGFIYIGLTLAYTVLPAIAFIYGSLNDSDPLNKLLPSSHELGIHLWRHVLFIFGISLGYLVLRGKQKPEVSLNFPVIKNNHVMIIFLSGILILCISFLTITSSPVESYYDHFTRYDHLPWYGKKFASLFSRLKYGFYAALFTISFYNYKKYRIFIAVSLVVICIYEVTYSFGARIMVLFILLQVLCLYNLFVKPISLKKGALAVFALGLLFSVIELFRSLEFDFGKAKDSVSEDGLKSASEFGSVFFPGFHLYSERANGTLPPIEWQMFFNDFISMFTFGDFSKWNPMDWYAKNYFPDFDVAPFTLGPIADSAIWGGEIDLLIRSIVNGLFFAYLVKLFIRFSNRWWAIMLYSYIFATSIMTLKYSVFYILTPLLKTIVPTLLIIYLVKYILETFAIKKPNQVQFK